MFGLARIVRYFGAYRRYVGKRLYLLFSLSWLVALTEVLGLALLLPLIALLQPQGAGNDPGLLGGGSGLEQYLFGLVAFVGVQNSLSGMLLFIGFMFALKGAIKFGEAAYASRLRAQMMEGVRTRLFDGYAGATYAYYSRHNTGHFADLFSVQVNTLVASFDSYKVFLTASINAAAYVLVVFLISWPVAVMVLAAGGLTLLLFRRLTEYVRRLSVRVAEESGTLNHVLVQTLQAFKYLVATGSMGSPRRALMDSSRKLAADQRKQGIAQGITDAAREPVAIFVLIGMLLMQMTLAGGGLGNALVAIVLIYRAVGQLVTVQSNWQKMMHRVGGLERVQVELGHLEGNQERGGAVALGPLLRAIEFDRVSFQYEAGRQRALQDLTLTIPANRTIALVGESGAGKSTLVDLLTLMLRPTSGDVRIDGVPSSEVDLSSWRRQIGYVSQETVVFDDTIANNISLWRGDYNASADVRARIEHAAAQACADAFVRALPAGFNERVGDRGVRLSGGQRQRLFIARELFKEPRLLILDEATSALDSEAEAVIRESVDQLRGSMTIVIIAHRLSTIRTADYIYVLEGGRLVEQGTYSDLIAARQGVFNRMVSLQAL